jgi:hypothetical protein
MGEERPNFYILLDLDPYAEWDADVFADALKAKQSQWTSASMGIGPQSLVAHRNRDLIPTIRRIMNDPQKRSEEAQKARILRVQRHENRLIEFERALQGKQLDADQVEQMIQEFSDVLTADEIRQKVRPHTRQLPPRSTIELSSGPIMEDFEQKLSWLGLSDLYDLLREPKTAPSTQLVQAAEELFTEMRRRQPQTPEAVAYGELASYARAIFSQAESRRRYDERLRQGQNGSSTRPNTNRNLQPSPSPQDIPAEPRVREPTKAPVQTPQAPPSSVLLTPLQTAPADIEELTLRPLEGGLRLTWLWPANCIETLILYSHSDWPQLGGRNTYQITVSRTEYEHKNGGHYDLYGSLNQPCYIHVQALLTHTGRRESTAGQRKEGMIRSTIGLRYEIKNPHFFGHPQRTLCLYAEPTAPVSIPVTLVLMIKRGSVPVFKEDGREFYRIEGSPAAPIEIETHKGKIIPLPLDKLTNHFGKLFVEDEQWASIITLHYTEREKLRFG